MKKLIYVLLAVSLITIPLSTANAITQEELENASETLEQIEHKTRQLRNCVNTAKRGKAGIVDITAEQKQELIDRYTSEKTELATLYQELP